MGASTLTLWNVEGSEGGVQLAVLKGTTRPIVSLKQTTDKKLISLFVFVTLS